MSDVAFLCTSEHMHPYECERKGKCRHCDRAYRDGHDPSKCEFCEQDCIEGRVPVYSFQHVHPPTDASDEFAAGWEAAMKFASEHGDGPFCRIKDRGWEGSGRDATRLRCERYYNHEGRSHEGHTDGGGVVYWPRYDGESV